MIKDKDQRPSTDELLQHPWLQSADATTAAQANTKSFAVAEDGKGNWQRNLAWVKITQNEVEKFSDIFKAIDVSGSGFLTPAELKQGLETKSEDFSLKSEDWQNVIESVQTNYDGNVGYNEFILACSQYTTNLNAKQIQELFTQIDSDNDGYLDMEEMKGFFREENYGESGASTTPEA